MKSGNTKISFLLLVIILSGATGWAIARLWPIWMTSELSVPLMTAVIMSGLAGFLFAWTMKVRAYLKTPLRRNGLNPIIVARSAALALASSRAASIAAGFYAGVLLLNALTFDTAASRRCIGISGLTVVASLAVVTIGLWLERMCRLPDDLDKTTANGVGI